MTDFELSPYGVYPSRDPCEDFRISLGEVTLVLELSGYHGLLLQDNSQDWYNLLHMEGEPEPIWRSPEPMSRTQGRAEQRRIYADFAAWVREEQIDLRMMEAQL